MLQYENPQDAPIPTGQPAPQAEPQVNQPPAYQPQANQPSASQSPTNQPPAYQSPTNQPPAYQSPTNQPPAYQSRQAPWEHTYQGQPAPRHAASAGQPSQNPGPANPVPGPAGPVPARQVPARETDDDAPTEMIDRHALQASLAAGGAAGSGAGGPGTGAPETGRPEAAGPYLPGYSEEPTVMLPPEAALPAETPTASPDGSATEPPASDTETETKKRPGWLLPAIIAGALIALLAGTYLIDWFVTKDEVAKGTSVGGVDIGGLTPEDAVAALQADMGARYQTPVSLKAHGQDVSLDPAAAGLQADFQASVDAAGTRSANPITRIQQLFGSTTELPVVVQTDDAALTAWVTDVAARTDVAAVEGSVTLTGLTVAVVEPVVGQHLDVAASTTVIHDAWKTGDPASLTGVELPTTSEPVRASAAGVQLANTELMSILAGPLTVNAGATPITVPVETVAAALVVAPDAGEGFAVTVDEAAIKATYQAAVEATQTVPADASIAIVDNAPLITPGVDGLVVDWAATDAALAAALRSPEHVLTVVYTVTPPEVTTAAIEALGIKEVIGEFTTGGFAYTSGQNVKTAAAEIDGALVQPGATFSLNEYTGPRGVDEGYIEAGIIQDGVAAKAVGGGISQLATTLYNASYFAGMEDVEHKAHSYYISRYPEGREATVFQNPDGSSVIDVAFKNDYGTAIIIQTIWTESDITVKIWGTKTVEVTSATSDRYNYTGAPTKTIPYGQSCSPSGGSSGFSVDNTRTITDLAGTVISQETTTTVYNGQVAVTCEPAPVVETPAPGETEGATPGG